MFVRWLFAFQDQGTVRKGLKGKTTISKIQFAKMANELEKFAVLLAIKTAFLKRDYQVQNYA